MNSIPSTIQISSIEPQSRTPLQNKVVNKLRETINKIVKDVIAALIDSKNMSADAIINEYVTKKLDGLSNLDLRTEQFSQQLLAVVDEDLNKIPALSQSFDALASHANDPFIRQKLVKISALPSIKELVSDFDAINHSIIDHINAHFHPVKPTWKTKFSSLVESKWPLIPKWQKTAAIVACASILFAYLFWPTKLLVPSISCKAEHPADIRSELETILSSTYKAPLFPTNNKELTNSFQWHMRIPDGENALQNGGSDFLDTLNRLIKEECDYVTSINIKYADERHIKLTLQSNCPLI